MTSMEHQSTTGLENCHSEEVIASQRYSVLTVKRPSGSGDLAELLRLTVGQSDFTLYHRR
ncbi:MAG: hypothetical protein GVY17_07885 [Cyanobacteria bacterium]|nr:hypothetical protein [Cyanobacteria bacterium GSL.Bin21]